MSAKVISIFSNKGGVGKTFVSVNLASALALSKQRVLLIDFDFIAGQDMSRMINLLPKQVMAETFYEMGITENTEEIKKYVVTHSSGFDFIAAVRNTHQIEQITNEGLKGFFKQVTEIYDYIIVDSGKNFSEPLITVFDYSNLILLVATPDVLAVYQAKLALEVLEKLQFPFRMIKVVLNRSESRGSVAWQEIRAALPCEIFSHIPSDGKIVGMALNNGVPCVQESPRSKIADSFSKMVNALRNEELCIPATQVEKMRKTEGLINPGAFWESFGIAQEMFAGPEGQKYSQEQDEILNLKRKIHEKLVERLNLDGIRPESLTDAQSLLNVKKQSEKVVLSLLVEESGGKIASHEERVRLVKDIIDEALGLGPLEDFLDDPEITDIMVNGKDDIYVEKKGKLLYTNKRFVSTGKMRAIIDRIIAPLGRRIDESTPMVDARLEDGSRINAIIPPLSLIGPMITIRKFPQDRLEISHLLNKTYTMNKQMADFLHACVLGRKNLIVSGGTGAGKTTLLNVISEFIPDNERIVSIEDAAELRLRKSHWARLESRPSNVEGKGQISIRDLFVNTLRMRPDRIIIGECRGGEVLDMLQAMNTGHDGSLTTLHANSTRDALTRLHSMILLAGIELPIRAISEMIASAIDVVVHINRFSDGTRKITGITEVAGLDDEYHVKLQDIYLYKQSGIDSDGKIVGDFGATGFIPSFFDELVTRGLKIHKEMFIK